MINFDDYTNENKLKHNPDWPYIPDYPYRILIIEGSGSGKENKILVFDDMIADMINNKKLHSIITELFIEN